MKSDFIVKSDFIIKKYHLGLIWWLVFVFLLGPIVLAQESSAGQESQFDNPNYVNSLTGAELASAIESGDLTRLGLVSDIKLAEALSSAVQSNNPLILTTLPETDLLRALRSDTTLMDNDVVITNFESRMASNYNFINRPQNSELRTKWFEHYLIEANPQAQVMGFKEGKVKTGTGKVVNAEFNPEEFWNAQVDEIGRLILEDGAKVSQAEASRDEKGEVVLKPLPSSQALLDLNEATGTGNRYHLQSGQARTKQGVYEFREGGTVTAYTYGTEFSGTNIKVVDPAAISKKDPRLLAQFSGTVTYRDDGPLTFGEDTTFFDFNSGNIYEVKKETDYCTMAEQCAYSANYIEYFPKQAGGALKVKASNDNDINIKITTLQVDQGVKSLDVEEITDESTVSINDNGRTLMKFSKEPLVVKGQPPGLTIKEVHYAFNYEGETHEQFIENGRVMQCSDCKDVGKVRTENLELSPEDTMQLSAMWAIRAAQDSRYAAEYGGRGNRIYDLMVEAYCHGQEMPCSLPTPDYFRIAEERDMLSSETSLVTGSPSGKKPTDGRISYAYDCIGFQGEAIYQATGRSYRFDLSTQGEQLSHNLVAQGGFQREVLVVGSDTAITQFTSSIYGTELVKEIRSGSVKVTVFPTAEMRADYMERNIPAGAPLTRFDTGTGMEIHNFLKGFGQDTIEAHIDNGKIEVNQGWLRSKYRDSAVLLATYPKR